MPNFSPNRAAPGIIRAAKLAYERAGPSVQGQLPYWLTVSPDPGKTTFWRDALIACGMSLRDAMNTVDDLNRAKRAW